MTVLDHYFFRYWYPRDLGSLLPLVTLKLVGQPLLSIPPLAAAGELRRAGLRQPSLRELCPGLRSRWRPHGVRDALLLCTTIVFQAWGDRLPVDYSESDRILDNERHDRTRLFELFSDFYFKTTSLQEGPRPH